jgi:hypothetical protein
MGIIYLNKDSTTYQTTIATMISVASMSGTKKTTSILPNSPSGGGATWPFKERTFPFFGIFLCDQHGCSPFGARTDYCADRDGCARRTKRAGARRLIGEPAFGLPADVRGTIIEGKPDRGVGRIGGVEKLEEFDEFAAAMAILDQLGFSAIFSARSGSRCSTAAQFVNLPDGCPLI